MIEWVFFKFNNTNDIDTHNNKDDDSLICVYIHSK